MGDLAHRSDYLFETRCRAELDDRDPLGQADVFVKGSASGGYVGRSIRPVTARSAKTSETQDHGERSADLPNLLKAEPFVEAPGVVVRLHAQAHRNEILFAGRGNQRL